ncbi:QWRF motif-containing protein 2-like isoform X2 [Syzygium oleosum]|nr:QWRF motif-containing protein 2-like isoform X2 [Syzygium oleosum]XP_056167351.1 QWRF motif-containing protein 2-like isoform X2 [Syzygium oleosum]
MVAAVSTPVNPNKAAAAAATGRGGGGGGGGGGGARAKPSRPPLLPSEPDNALAPPRRAKGREVTSRYLSSSSASSTRTTSSSSASSTSSSASSCSSSKRCPSPLISRTAAAAATPGSGAAKRSQSAERRRPATDRPSSADSRGGGGASKGGEMTAAQKLLVTSARSLSVSFQGESYSLPVSKAKSSPAPSSTRKGTPERRKPVTAATPRRDQLENSKPVEKQRWPGRSRQENFLSRSVDFGEDRRRTGGSRGNVVRALQTSMMIDVRASLDGRLLVSDSSDHGLGKADEVNVHRSSGFESNGRTDCSSSDSESVSSGSTKGVQECGGGQEQNGPRGVVVPARFWQQTINRMRRQPEVGTPLLTSPFLKMSSAPKLVMPKKPGFDSPVSSPKGPLSCRGQASPIRGAVRPASPSKLTHLAVSSPRGLSPSWARNAVAGTPLDVSASNIPSFLSFAAEARRGKMGESRMVDAHGLRLLHNRLLQWRFVNARADEALSAQTLHTERSIYNAWLSIFKLRESVKTKRIELQLQRQNLKLTSVVHGQIRYLEEWASMDQDYSNSLSGANEALKASTLRLPVIGGARVDIRKVKNAISSAVEVMQTMASSICLFSSEVGDVYNLMAELARVSSQEHAVLDQCRDLLSMIAAMQVNESSLRTHLLQVQCTPSASSFTVET